MNTDRVLVALSGGVDSAVAAALLIDQGYEVAAAALDLWVTPSTAGNAHPEVLSGAKDVADRLGIPFHPIDGRESFRAQVVDPFIAAYGRGRTPNPCVTCNRTIKFGLLLDHALSQGFEFLATGHYARVRRGDRLLQLLRGRDGQKDQSYFLYTLTQGQLGHVLFPVGDLTKGEVRQIADRRDLPVAHRPASQDICFLAEGDYRSFLTRQAPHLIQPGPIRDTSARLLGQHSGLAAYTIGQRKGLGITAAEPLYVLAIEPAENTLVVGTAGELGQDACDVEGVHFVRGQPPTTPFSALAQVRYRARPVQVTVALQPGRRAHVHFTARQRAITPGQSLVLYAGQVVLGGGVICDPGESVL